MMSKSPLRLEAFEISDLEVISACLQDSITRVDDMSYFPRMRRFVIGVTRFRWELAHGISTEGDSRVKCGVQFDNVLRVQTQGIDVSDKEGFLQLLAINSVSRESGNSIECKFGGGGSIMLDAEVIACRMGDMENVWMTPNRPDHGLADQRE